MSFATLDFYINYYIYESSKAFWNYNQMNDNKFYNLANGRFLHNKRIVKLGRQLALQSLETGKKLLLK